MYFKCAVIPENDYLCSNIPNYWWPRWVGGEDDFLKQGQPFGDFHEMRLATMLEF